MIEEKLKGDTPRQKYESLCEIIKALERISRGATSWGGSSLPLEDSVIFYLDTAKKALAQANL